MCSWSYSIGYNCDKRPIFQKAGFELAQRCFGNDGFGGQQFPKIFMTVDSEADRQALKTVWPDSKQLLCRHVCESIWRWLWSDENNIEKSDFV